MKNTEITSRTYFFVMLSLMALLGLTVFLASLNLGAFHIPVALAIAMAKIALIALYFMHLKVAPPLFRVAAGASLVWLMILFTLTLSDYLMRSSLSVPGK